MPTFLDPASLEPRVRSPWRPLDHSTFESRLGIANPTHLTCVVGAVCSQVQASAGAQERHQPSNHIGPDQAASALALLGPWVGEERTNLRERSRRDAIQEIDDVAVDDAHVHQPSVLDRLENRGDPRRMDVDPDDTLVRTHVGKLDQSFSRAETNVEYEVACIATENLIEQQTRPLYRESPPGQGSLVSHDSRR